MQLEDPRIRYRQLQNERASTESIPLQTASQVSYYLLPIFLYLTDPDQTCSRNTSEAALCRFYK